MKATKTILTLSMLIIALCSFARKPPVSVQKAFEQRFSGATNVTWIKETSEMWEAVFNVNGKENSADFALDGTWIDTEIAIEISDLPMSVRTSLLDTNHDWVVIAANKIETAYDGIIYTMDIVKGVLKKAVSFKEDGIPLI